MTDSRKADALFESVRAYDKLLRSRPVNVVDLSLEPGSPEFWDFCREESERQEAHEKRLRKALASVRKALREYR